MYKESILNILIKYAESRPYSYSHGVYTFDNIGNKEQAVLDIEQRYKNLRAKWESLDSDNKKSFRDQYQAKMKAIAEEKNRLSRNYGYSWRYNFNSRSGKIEAYRELRNKQLLDDAPQLMNTSGQVKEIVKEIHE